MKKTSAILLAIILGAVSLSACGSPGNHTPGAFVDPTESIVVPETGAADSVTDPEDAGKETKAEFRIDTKVLNGFTVSDNVYTITKEGEYTLSGNLSGRISVEAPDNAKVELVLAGVNILCGGNAPIYAKSADKLTITVAENTYNKISDLRAKRDTDEEEESGAPEQGNAAIYARADLNVKGTGTLVVSGGYNNGIHSTKDLKLSDVTLKVTAPHNALKGNASVTVKSGSHLLIATAGDGIKTKNSDVSAKLNQRGTVEIQDGAVDIYAAYDGIDAAYDAVISGGNVNIRTGAYSKYSAGTDKGSDFYIIVPRNIYSADKAYYAYFYNEDSNAGVFVKATYATKIYSGMGDYYHGLLLTAPGDYDNAAYFVFPDGTSPSTAQYDAATEGNVINKTTNGFLLESVSDGVAYGDYVTITTNSAGGLEHSEKGIKAANTIQITNGTVTISATDDGLHANTGELQNEKTGEGAVKIAGGVLVITTGDDAIHADASVTIEDGTVQVKNSYEGIEAPQVTVNGGHIWVYASDDGINACGGGFGGMGRPGSASADGSNSDRAITINGGYLEIETASGDTDAIDSNGNYKQTGGFVLVKGGSSQGNMAGSVDVDGTITVTGGAIVALGGICEVPENSVNANVLQGTRFEAGYYTLTGSDGKTVLSFTLTGSYLNGWICSELLTTGVTYTLTKDSEEVASWTQTAGTMNAGSVGGFGGHGNKGGFGGPQKRRFP